MGKKIGIWVAILFAVGMIGYGIYTMQGEQMKVLAFDIEELVMDLEIRVSDYLDGYEVIMTDLSGHKDLLYSEKHSLDVTALLDDIRASHPEISYIYYGTKTGEMFISPETALPDSYDPRERPWYLDAINSKDFIWTEPYMDIENATLTLSGAQSVDDDYGVLGFDLELDEGIFQLVSDLAVDYEVMVISKGGSIIYHEN